MIYGTISEFCTPSSCPDMLGPGPRQYLWQDEKGKKSRLSAPQYIDYIMTYVQKTINDEATFPTKHGNDFPTSFDTHIRKIHRLLFHVLAHTYHSHFKEIVLLQLHAHLNAVFVHFVEFSLRFHLVEEKELEVTINSTFFPQKCHFMPLFGIRKTSGHFVLILKQRCQLAQNPTNKGAFRLF